MSSTIGLFYPISIIQGETLDIAFDIAFDNVLSDVQVVDFVGKFGSVISSEFRELFSFTFVVDTLYTYIMHATYSATDTSILDVGKYTYQIQLTEADTSIKTIIYGSMDVIQSFIQ